MNTIILFSIYILFIIISGASEAVMDKIQFHYNKSIFLQFKKQLFWDPSMSWKNKYKNGDPKQGCKFIFSTTYFVFATDAWHLFKFLKNTFIFASIGIAMYAQTCALKDFDLSKILTILLFVILGRAFYGLSFNLCFDKILKSD